MFNVERCYGMCVPSPRGAHGLINAAASARDLVYMGEFLSDVEKSIFPEEYGLLLPCYINSTIIDVK